MRFLNNRRGQGLIEYILVVVLMGLMAVIALRKLSSSTNKAFTDSAKSLTSVTNGLPS